MSGCLICLFFCLLSSVCFESCGDFELGDGSGFGGERRGMSNSP